MHISTNIQRGMRNDLKVVYIYGNKKSWSKIGQKVNLVVFELGG